MDRKDITAKKYITLDKVIESIKKGHNTVRGMATDLNVHRESMRSNLYDMYQAGEIDRNKIGQTYIYSLKDE